MVPVRPAPNVFNSISCSLTSGAKPRHANITSMPYFFWAILCAGCALRYGTCFHRPQPRRRSCRSSSGNVARQPRKAFNEQNYSFAAAKFQELFQKFSGHPQVNAARYGLALSYIDGAERNFEKAIDPLNALAGNAGFPEHANAVYYLVFAHRGIAMNDLASAENGIDGLPQGVRVASLISAFPWPTGKQT